MMALFRRSSVVPMIHFQCNLKCKVRKITRRITKIRSSHRIWPTLSGKLTILLKNVMKRRVLTLSIQRSFYSSINAIQAGMRILLGAEVGTIVVVRPKDSANLKIRIFNFRRELTLVFLLRRMNLNKVHGSSLEKNSTKRITTERIQTQKLNFIHFKQLYQIQASRKLQACQVSAWKSSRIQWLSIKAMKISLITKAVKEDRK